MIVHLYIDSSQAQSWTRCVYLAIGQSARLKMARELASAGPQGEGKNPAMRLRWNEIPQNSDVTDADNSVGPRPGCQSPEERRSGGPALRPCGFYLGMCGLGAAPAGAPGISSAALQPGMCRRSGEFTSPGRRKAAATVCRPKGRLYGRGLPRSQALYARAGRKHGARRARRRVGRKC